MHGSLKGMLTAAGEEVNIDEVVEATSSLLIFPTNRSSTSFYY